MFQAAFVMIDSDFRSRITSFADSCSITFRQASETFRPGKHGKILDNVYPKESNSDCVFFQSIFSYNGGSVVAMKGANCVAIASDLRYGRDLATITTDFSKCFEMSPHLWLGLSGLTTDVQTVQQKMEFRMRMYELSESRKMKPKTFASVLSNMLYERRFGPFFVNPVVAGLTPGTLEPFICSMDLIGCTTEPEDFAVAGTSEEGLFGKVLFEMT